MQFRTTIIADLRACHMQTPEDAHFFRIVKDVMHATLFRHDFACVFHLRLNQRLAARFPRLGALMAQRRYYLFANDISPLAKIGPGLRLHHTANIVIGRDAKIGVGAHIYNGVTVGAKSMDRGRDMPTIGNNVVIGANAKVLGKITVGDNAVIGTLTLCTVDVPANTVAIGNPIHMFPRGAH